MPEQPPAPEELVVFVAGRRFAMPRSTVELMCRIFMRWMALFVLTSGATGAGLEYNGYIDWVDMLP